MSEQKKGYSALKEVIKLEAQVIALQKALKQIMDNNPTLAIPSLSTLNKNRLDAVHEVKKKYADCEGIDDLIS